MGLNQLFNRELVFCLDVANQEELFDQVATLLEERQIVTDSYRAALKEREKSFPTGTIKKSGNLPQYDRT